MAAKELLSRRKTNRFRSIFTSLMAPLPQCRTYKKASSSSQKGSALAGVFSREKHLFCELNIVSFGWEDGETYRSKDFLSVH